MDKELAKSRSKKNYFLMHIRKLTKQEAEQFIRQDYGHEGDENDLHNQSN